MGAAIGALYGWVHGISITKTAAVLSAAFTTSYVAHEILQDVTKYISQRQNWQPKTVSLIKLAGDACLSAALSIALFAAGILTKNSMWMSLAFVITSCTLQGIYTVLKNPVAPPSPEVV